jgi:hypothetical protein
MRVIIPILVGLAALAATPVQSAPLQPNGHSQSKFRETPAQNVKKSAQYDYLVSTSSSFRRARMRKECGPIGDPQLRSSCMASFGANEPLR